MVEAPEAGETMEFFTTLRTTFRGAAVAALVAFAPSWGWAQASLQQQIDDALKPKPRAPLTRSLAGGAPANPKAAEEGRFVQRLRTRAIAVEPAQQTIPVEERAKIAEMSREKSKIDLEIYFDYNSWAVGPKALPALTALGSVLAKDEHRGTVFFINGHTDAAGSPDYNLVLSQRRAEAVRRVLIEQFRLPPDTLIATGFGKEQPKFPDRPYADKNRRVQIVNTEHKATAGR